MDKQKHLTLDSRIIIETKLNEGESFKAIGRFLNKVVWIVLGKHTFCRGYRKRNICRKTSKTDFYGRYIRDIPSGQSISAEKPGDNH